MKRIATLISSVFLLSAFTIQAQVNNPWIVPEEYQEMVNPVEPNKKSMDAGKKLYKNYCMSCHGEYGHGDGVAAVELNVDPSDLTFDDIDTQKDGELFFKIKSGHDEMKTFSNILTDEQIWDLVNYIRTFYSKKE
jgi:mono/diheme cytochrome c family protein